MNALILFVAGAVSIVLLALWLRPDDRVGMPSSGSPGSTDSVESALHAGRKIDAIKLYREQNGVGLRDAKEAVEALQNSLRGG